MSALADVAAAGLWATRLRCPQIHRPGLPSGSSGLPLRVCHQHPVTVVARQAAGDCRNFCVRDVHGVARTGRVTLSGARAVRQEAIRSASKFLGSIKAPVPSSRPAIPSAFARKPGQSRRACGGTGATRSPRLGASMARTHTLTGLSTTPRCRQRRGTQKVARCWPPADAVQASRVKRSA